MTDKEQLERVARVVDPTLWGLLDHCAGSLGPLDQAAKECSLVRAQAAIDAMKPNRRK